MNVRKWLILAGVSGVLCYARPSLAGGIPLPQGLFAFTLSGSFAICIDPATGAEEPCSTPDVLAAPLTALVNGAVTIDKNGNSCGSIVETDTIFPADATPPFLTANEHVTRSVTAYDSSTGTGDESFTGYTGGSCNGSRFNSTGAKPLSSGTDHFVVSERGKRVDLVLTALTNPNNSGGGFSLSGVYHAQ